MGAADKISTGTITYTARRCKRGFPQVIACAAEKDGKPFPTTFWLLCPHLSRVAGALEAQNGVAAMEYVLAGRRDEWRLYHLFHARLRLAGISPYRKKFLRRYASRRYEALRRGGVGGIAVRRRQPITTVKCLHLQIASYLGARFHPASDWLESSVSSWECDGCQCCLKDDGGTGDKLLSQKG